MRNIYESIGFTDFQSTNPKKLVNSINNKRISFVEDVPRDGYHIIRAKGAVKERNKFYKIVGTIDKIEDIKETELAKAIQDDCILISDSTGRTYRVGKETKVEL